MIVASSVKRETAEYVCDREVRDTQESAPHERTRNDRRTDVERGHAVLWTAAGQPAKGTSAPWQRQWTAWPAGVPGQEVAAQPDDRRAADGETAGSPPTARLVVSLCTQIDQACYPCLSSETMARQVYTSAGGSSSTGYSRGHLAGNVLILFSV